MSNQHSQSDLEPLDQTAIGELQMNDNPHKFEAPAGGQYVPAGGFHSRELDMVPDDDDSKELMVAHQLHDVHESDTFLVEIIDYYVGKVDAEKKISICLCIMPTSMEQVSR